MSRCFPFPPPGYERKIKADNSDLLKKEKHKEKKHKREKKDKEKKESNENREKERSDEKRREKKDKKDKHKNKKERDLDKDKLKGNGMFPDEKNAVGPSNASLHKLPEKSKDREVDRRVTSGEERVSNLSVFNNGVSVSKHSHLVSQTKNINNSAAFSKRNTSEDKERRNSHQLPDRNVSTERKKDGVYKFTGTEAIPVVDGKGTPNSKPAVVNMDLRSPLVDGKGTLKAKPAVVNMDLLGSPGEAKVKGDALVQNVREGRLLGKSAPPLANGRERKEKQAIDGKVDERASVGDLGEARSSATALPSTSVGMVQNRVGAMARPVEKKLEQKSEENVKVRRKEDDYPKGEKRKERDKEKPTLKDKETKKEEKVKAGSEQKIVQMPKKRDSEEIHKVVSSSKNENKMDLSGSLSDGLQSTVKPSIQIGDSVLGKRKDIGLNGIYDELMPEPNKLARVASSTLPMTEPGTSLEPCQNSVALGARPPMNIKVDRTFAPDDTQRPPTNIKVDGKDHKVNGINTAPLAQSSQTSRKAERKSDVSAKAKPPHPDTKYLGQVLSVPKSDGWPEFDDQEWLFNNSSSGTRMPQAETSEVDEDQKVWANVLWLEPVDIFALPYVIPH